MSVTYKSACMYRCPLPTAKQYRQQIYFSKGPRTWQTIRN